MRKVLIAATLLLAACAQTVDDGSKISGAAPPEQAVAPPLVPQGYMAQLAGWDMVDPRAILFAADGTPLVLEGAVSRLSAIGPDGHPVVVAQGGANGPWTGAVLQGESLYVAEAGTGQGGRIVRIGEGGAIHPLTRDLPAGGVVGPLAAGPDGMLYVGVGTSGRSIGRDGPDIPCQNVRLQSGGRVRGAVPCTGSVLQVDPADGAMAVYAWGFFNPKAVAFAPDGRLMVADDLPPEARSQQALLWEAIPGLWYGWPDFLGQVAAADPLLAAHPNPPPAPVTTLGGDIADVVVPQPSALGGGRQAFLAVTDEDGTGKVMFAPLDSGAATPFMARMESPSALAAHGSELWVAEAGTGRIWRISAENNG